MKKTFYYLAIAFISLIGWSSCEKIEENNDDRRNPIELSIETNGNSITLSWTRTNVSTFEKYIIIRSSQPFPDEFTSPTAIFFPMEQIVSIEDIDENTYTDFGSVLSDKVYYRVFADIGDRFLTSGNVETDVNVDILPFLHSAVNFSPELDELFFIMESNAETAIHKKNYKTDVSSNKTLSLSSSYYTKLFMVNNDNGEELFMSDDYENEFTKYDPSDISFQEQYYAGNDVYSIATSQSGLICATTDDYQGSIHVYTPGNNLSPKKHNYSTYYSGRLVASVSDSENEFIEAGTNELHYYNFSSAGNLITHISSFVNSSSLGAQIAVSPNNEYFVTHRNGVIYNKDLSVFKTLSTENNNGFFRDFVFSADGNKLYAIDAFTEKILVYSFPELEVEREVKMGYNPLQLFIDEGKLIVIGTGFDAQVSTYRSIFQVFDF